MVNSYGAHDLHVLKGDLSSPGIVASGVKVSA